MAAEANYRTPEVRGTGQEELPHARAQGRWPRRATPHPRSGEAGRPTARPRSGEVAERGNPTTKEQWLPRPRRAQRSYSTFKVRRGSVKTYPSSKVRGGGMNYPMPDIRGSGLDKIPHARGQGQRQGGATPH